MINLRPLSGHRRGRLGPRGGAHFHAGSAVPEQLEDPGDEASWKWTSCDGPGRRA